MAASWLFHEDLRRSAATRHVCSNHCGRSFGQRRASGWQRQSWKDVIHGICSQSFQRSVAVPLMRVEIRLQPLRESLPNAKDSSGAKASC